ncbi:MAG: protein tyrosine phosphatase [Pseudomonadota bacterium]
MNHSVTKHWRRKAAAFGNRGRKALAERSPSWLKRAFGPTALHADMLLTDHGIFRTIYLNRHRLDAFAERSAQPTPGQIARMARRGVKTIVNLRGARFCGSYELERAECSRHGIALINFVMRSRAAPTPDEIRGAVDLLDRIDYPMVLHCKSGADRAGLMSVIYLWLHRGVPLETARKQLSLRFGHIRQAQTGVLDRFFEAYLEANAAEPIDFWVWLDTVYDPDRLKAEFVSNSVANRVVDTVLRRE